MNLVPIKVKIGLNENGGAKYPDFNSIDSAIRNGMDWAYYIDRFGSGWIYDSTGHKEIDPDSPFGEQWGLILIPKDFADAAIAQFPECTKLTDVEAQSFYETKAKKNEPEELLDNDVLIGIKAKQDLGLTLTPDQQKALDPNDDTLGVRKNKMKQWNEYKKKLGIKVVS